MMVWMDLSLWEVDEINRLLPASSQALVESQRVSIFIFVWRMPFSGIWLFVDIEWTVFSEELIASTFRVENPLAKNKREQVPADRLHVGAVLSLDYRG